MKKKTGTDYFFFSMIEKAHQARTWNTQIKRLYVWIKSSDVFYPLDWDDFDVYIVSLNGEKKIARLFICIFQISIKLKLMTENGCKVEWFLGIQLIWLTLQKKREKDTSNWILAENSIYKKKQPVPLHKSLWTDEQISFFSLSKMSWIRFGRYILNKA